MFQSVFQEMHARTRVAAAKTRARRRATDAGAVMFIVAMTLAVIAAMGIYALNVAGTEVKTAGFVREQMQTQYLSEFAVLGTSNTVAGSNAGTFANYALNRPTSYCMSIFGTPPTAGKGPLACYTLNGTQMAAWWNPPPGSLLLPWVSNASETTRGSVGLPTAPDFYVELTEPYELPLRRCATGYDIGMSGCCFEFTVTAVGLSMNTAGVYISEGLAMARSRIIAGPTSTACNQKTN
jgi:hypothetical protein